MDMDSPATSDGEPQDQYTGDPSQKVITKKRAKKNFKRAVDKALDGLEDRVAIVQRMQAKYRRRAEILDRPLQIDQGGKSQNDGQYQTRYWNQTPSTQGWLGDR